VVRQVSPVPPLGMGLYQACRRRGEQASLDHSDLRGVSTPIRSAPADGCEVPGRAGLVKAAGRSGAADGQQPQFAAPLHRRGPVGGAELGIDPADVAVDGVHRYRQLAGDLTASEVRRQVAQYA